MTLDQYPKNNGHLGGRTKNALAAYIAAKPWTLVPPFDASDEARIRLIVAQIIDSNRNHIRGLGNKGLALLAKFFKIKLPQKNTNASAMMRQLAKSKKRIAELERGEFICKKCGLRKNAEKVEADF